MKPSGIVAIIISGFIGLILVSVSGFNIYLNGKSDGFGGGSLKVTNCREVDWSWRIYECAGNYSSGAGMIYVENLTVKVRGEYKPGERIGDLYPTAYSYHDNSAWPTSLITGFERTSVYYNIPWILVFMAGLLIPAFTVVYTVLTRRKHAKRT